MKLEAVREQRKQQRQQNRAPERIDQSMDTECRDGNVGKKHEISRDAMTH